MATATSYSEERERRNRKMQERHADVDETTEALMKGKQYKEAYHRCIELIANQQHVRYAKDIMRELIEIINKRESKKDGVKELGWSMLLLLIGVMVACCLGSWGLNKTVIIIIMIAYVSAALCFLKKRTRIDEGVEACIDGIRLEFTPQITCQKIGEAVKNTLEHCVPETYEGHVDLVDQYHVLLKKAQIRLRHNEVQQQTDIEIEVLSLMNNMAIMKSVKDAIIVAIPDMIDDSIVEK